MGAFPTETIRYRWPRGNVSALILAPSRRRWSTLVLAHGAGAGQQHPFMVGFASALAARGLDVMTFNSPYIERGRKVPDPGAVLEDCYRSVVTSLASSSDFAGPLFVGGKSMGGRIASQMAARWPGLPVAGLMFLDIRSIRRASQHGAGRAPVSRRRTHAVRAGRPRRIRHTTGAPTDSVGVCRQPLSSLYPTAITH